MRPEWIHADHQTACPHPVGKVRRKTNMWVCTAGRQVVSGKDFLQCDGENCYLTVKDNGWAKSRAGWFFQRDGKGFCPDHRPEWYDDWVIEKLMRKLETQLGIRLWTMEYEGGDK